MRTREDLVPVRVTITRELSIDMEQLESYPRFISILDTLRSVFTLTTEAGYQRVVDFAIKEYIEERIRNDDFPYKTPGTTGPGRVYDVKVEVIRNGSNA
jgi:hypothetical protein